MKWEKFKALIAKADDINEPIEVVPIVEIITQIAIETNTEEIPLKKECNIKSEKDYYTDLFNEGRYKPDDFRSIEKKKMESDWFHEFKYDLLNLAVQISGKKITKEMLEDLINRETPKYRSHTKETKRLIAFLEAGSQRNASGNTKDQSESVYRKIYTLMPGIFDWGNYAFDSRSGYVVKKYPRVDGGNLKWNDGDLFFNRELIDKQYNIKLGKWKSTLKAEAKKLHLKDKEKCLEEEIQDKNQLKLEKEAELKRLEGLSDNAGIVDFIRQIEEGETDFMPDEIWEGYERLSETGLIIKANEMLSQIKYEQEQIKSQTDKAKEIANQDIQKIFNEILSFQAKDEALVEEEIKTYAKIKRESVLIKENKRRSEMINEIKKSFIPKTNQLRENILESITQ